MRLFIWLAATLLTLGVPAFAQDSTAEAPAPPPVPAAPGGAAPGQGQGQGGMLGGIQQMTDPLVRMDARITGDGLVRDGEWANLHVRLANLGEPLEGTLVLHTRTAQAEDIVYRRRVELPAGSRKDVRLLFKAGLGNDVRRVDFEAGARSIAVESRIRYVDENDVAIGIIGEDSGGLQTVRTAWPDPVPGRAPSGGSGLDKSQPRNVRLGLIPVAQVPDRPQGLDTFNWVVWPDADPTKLSPEQTAALRAWVAGGGHLFLTVTERWRQVGQGPLADLMPVDLESSPDGDAADQVLVAMGAASTGLRMPQVHATLREVPGRRVQAIDDPADGVAWAIGTYGLGTVSVLTADPRLAPLGTALPRETLWRHLLHLPEPGASRSDYDVLRPDLVAALDAVPAPVSQDNTFIYGNATNDPEWMVQVFTFLQDIPGVAPLPLPWLLGFAFAYLLVIGPLDYLILRALGRQPLTWITFPVSIAVFSTAALLGTSYVKGSQAVVTRYEVVDILPGTDLWRGVSWYGIWATRRTDLSMSSGFGDGVAEVLEDKGYRRDLRIEHGTGASALHWGAETWTLSHARTLWTAPGTGGITASRVGDDFQVVNGTDLDLEDALLLHQGDVYTISALPAGGTARATRMQDRFSWETAEYPSEALVVQDAWTWAIGNAFDIEEVRRGRLAEDEWAGVVYAISPTPIEPSQLEGLQPVPRSITVVRAPLATIEGL